MINSPERSNSEASPTASAAPSSTTARANKIPACVQCAARKIKCDRNYPCSNCVRSRQQCVRANLAQRPRRRRFPERALLDRLRQYESILRQNNIPFEPLHKDVSIPEKQSPGGGDEGDVVDDDEPSEAIAQDGPSLPQAKNFWHAMNQKKAPDSDDEDGGGNSSTDEIRAAVIEKAWDDLDMSPDPLLFGSRKNTDLAILHPGQVEIFRLWQIYLDNVNPLLKVTHTPTLQGRIIEAASNVASIKPSLEALMFSIYCIALESLTESEYQGVFKYNSAAGTPREQTLAKYRLGCQQALLKSGFLRTRDRECLTALYLYLISVRTTTDPQSLFAFLGLTVRIAQRMGLHSEAAHAKCTPFEAEMRRRLWWSLVLFDTRICGMSDCKAIQLLPTWDCRTPLSVNDFELQPDMKEPPSVQGQTSEAIFAVVRSQIGDFERHSAYHLDFCIPALKRVARNLHGGPVPEGGEMVTLEKNMEETHLKHCNPGNPLHFMTIWTARNLMARDRLHETYSKFLKSSKPPTDDQRDVAFTYALRMLECDTTLTTSPMSHGYMWFINSNFPFVAYIHILQDLKRRPMCVHADTAWEAMSDNYVSRGMPMNGIQNPFFNVFAKTVLQAWDAREALLTQLQKPLVTPLFVSDILQKTAPQRQEARKVSSGQTGGAFDMDDFFLSMTVPVNPSGRDMMYGLPGVPFQGSGLAQDDAALGFDATQTDWSTTMDWNTMDWNPIGVQGGAW